MWPYRLVWLVALVAGYFSAYAQPDLGRSLPPCHRATGWKWKKPLPPCGAGTYWDTATGHWLQAPKTLGEGNGLGNLNPRYFDLNGDGMLDTEDFINVLNVFGKVCN